MKHVSLKNITDERGSLAVIEKILPFDVKRVFFLHSLSERSTRGGHGHFETKMALLATAGSFKVRVNNGRDKEVIHLSAFDSVLILQPEDWHLLYDFTPDCVVTVLASKEYDKEDYFFVEPT